MDIKDALKNNLKGDALENALGFAYYLIEKGLEPVMEWDKGCRFVKNGRSPCLFVFNMQNNGEWFICDMPVTVEPEWEQLCDSLKEFILSNIKVCSVHVGEPCGCGSEPGVSKVVFGKGYDNLCTAEIQFINPDAGVLKKLKEVVEWWAGIV